MSVQFPRDSPLQLNQGIPTGGRRRPLAGEDIVKVVVSVGFTGGPQPAEGVERVVFCVAGNTKPYSMYRKKETLSSAFSAFCIWHHTQKVAREHNDK